MRAVELFAGAGGAALGMHSAGVEHLACIELDENAAATLAAAGFPAVCGDVRDLSLLNDLHPDLVWSSFPCQCWSSAGKRLGAQDDRNGWPWTVDALEILRPRWFIAENVTGLTHHKGECDPVCVGPELCPAAYLDRVIFPDLLRFFECVDMRVLDCAAYGVPQRRRRLVIVAGPSRITWPAPTHGKPTKQGDLFGRKLLPWRTVRDALNITSGRVIGGGTRGHGMAEWKPRDCTDEPGPCVNAMQSSTAGIYMVGGSEPHRLDQPSPTVCAMPGGKGCGQWSANQSLRESMEEQTGVRRLTVQECAILQDFPPGHPWQGTKTSQYTQVGNAVPPTLARVVVEAVIKADRGQA